MSLHQHSSSAEKIARFRDLFRGRSDVFPQRFESAKTGRAGYSPACANEWIKGICEKPRIKCSDCPHQKWTPVDDHVIRWHLSGMDSNRRPFVMGVYPMLPDESCHLLAIDLDGEHWQTDSHALAAVVKELKLPLAMERSRSGEGAHLWLFFAEPIPASIARRLGTYLLSEAMERRPEIGMASYDRMFPNQDTLFVTLPVSWRGTISQYAGRLHRLHADKRLVQIYDYADLDTPMLSRMFDKRCAAYEALGYSILLPGSALPGWPQTVPLPVDPTWKRQYAATVKRLILDGVDVPLAELFVQTAQPTHSKPNARSASEAFLHRRLQTLDATRDRFSLNAKLPIPFDLNGQMEVDFLCAEARLVIELDGPQHLGDPEAWRSDRRKDQLLQRHGYFILRFLTSDLSENLPAVLDTLLTVLASRVSKKP